MPTPTNYEGLTLKQLSKIQSDIAAAMARKVAEAEKAVPSLEAEAVSLINRLVSKQGLPPAKTAVTVQFPQNGNGNGEHKVKAKSRKRSKIAVKFRNPSNPAETWSGRGRPARWLAALEKQGHKRAEYAVR